MATALPAREEKLLPPGQCSALSPGCGLEPGWGTIKTRPGLPASQRDADFSKVPHVPPGFPVTKYT